MDRVIQNNQPLFVLVWVGSVLALVAAAVLGLWELSGADRLLVIVAALVYLLCVQLPTVTINIPLNNSLQKLDSSTMNEMTRKQARDGLSPLESMERRQGRVREPGIPLIDASPHQSVNASDSWTGGGGGARSELCGGMCKASNCPPSPSSPPLES
jgi:hypothetical protein